MAGRIGLSAMMVLLCASGVAWAFEVPLTVEEMWGQAGLRQVTGGVPLLVGQAKDAAALRLSVKGADGTLAAVPAQFRPLARWWQKDNSLRWVLVDFATPMAAREKKTFILSDGPAAAPAGGSPLSVEQTDQAITVTTGPARFVVSRKKFAFLDAAYVDADGDGKFTASENLLTASSDLGTVIEDTYGEKYYGSESVRSVEVVEQGAVRVCVRARGTHRARDGKGYSRGMYSYDYFINFYAGSTEVFVDLILGNHPPKSIGSPTFEDASLRLRLAGEKPTYTIIGEKAQNGALAAGQSICLYQDSNGAPTWEACQGYDGDPEDDGWNFPRGVTASFRGFRVYDRAGGKEEVIASGDHARGLMRLTTDRGGVIVHTKHFWQQFPKAVEVFGDGTFRLGLFPREYKVVHFLEDTSAKGHEIVFSFFGPKGGADPAAVAAPWDSRVYPRPPIEHIAAAGALADIGPFTVPTSGLSARPDARVDVMAPRMLEDDTLYGNACGWQVFGERWRSQGGHGNLGARQPMNEDDYLRRWYWTGVREWFAAGDARSRHFRDLRCYRIEDQNPFGFADWLTFRAANMSEHRADRPQPRDEEYKKYSQGLWNRFPFWFPNPEHSVLDLLYDRYLLMGDERSLENMRVIAAHGGYYAGYQTPVVTRDRGWCWRSIDRYWELTGDKDAERLLRRVIENQKALIGKEPLISGTPQQPNWWFTTIFSRAVAQNALHMGDPTCLELAKSMAVGKERSAQNVSTLLAVLYHLTGDERYKDLVLGPDGKGRQSLGVGGYLYGCDDWLLRQPPRVKSSKGAGT
jgi:hypothetical protein